MPSKSTNLLPMSFILDPRDSAVAPVQKPSGRCANISPMAAWLDNARHRSNRIQCPAKVQRTIQCLWALYQIKYQMYPCGAGHSSQIQRTKTSAQSKAIRVDDGIICDCQFFGLLCDAPVSGANSKSVWYTNQCE